MKKYIIQVAYIFIISIFASCEQKISLKKTTLTGINSLSYTDVIFKSNRDTILVSKFNGEISQIIKNKNTLKKSLIINLNDEIYSLAYDHLDGIIYASTLNNGIVVIDEKKGTVEKILPIKNKWTTAVTYDQNERLLFASGYTKTPYLWKVDDNYKLLSNLKDFEKMQPKAISEDGIVYFDGNGVVGLWENTKNMAIKTLELKGRITDIDSEGHILSITDKKFMVKNINTDSLLFEKTHPNWPIYVSSKDTTVKVPVSLPLTDALLSKRYIFTSSIDKSIRKWNIDNGELLDDFLGHKATISSLSLSNDETQLVSVDLKGGVKFWELKKN